MELHTQVVVPEVCSVVGGQVPRTLVPRTLVQLRRAQEGVAGGRQEVLGMLVAVSLVSGGEGRRSLAGWVVALVVVLFLSFFRRSVAALVEALLPFCLH